MRKYVIALAAALLPTMGMFAQTLAESFSHLDTATHGHDVNVVGGAFEEKVTHVATHKVAFLAEGIGGFRELMEKGSVEFFFYFFLCKYLHFLKKEIFRAYFFLSSEEMGVGI